MVQTGPPRKLDLKKIGKIIFAIAITTLLSGVLLNLVENSKVNQTQTKNEKVQVLTWEELKAVAEEDLKNLAAQHKS